MIRRLAFVSCLLVGIGLVPSAKADLTAFYSGNGNANDSVSGQNGTLENGAGFGPGLFGQSFLFNGTNQYVSVPNDSNWSLGSAFTINLFVNLNAIKTGSEGQLPNVFVGDDVGGGSVNKWVFSYDGEGNLFFHINSPTLGPIFITAPTTISLTTHAWYDLAVTYSNNTYTFYENGVSLGTVTNSDAIPAAEAPLTIGEAEGIGYLNGSIENLGIYNNALSASQIQALAAAVPEPMSLGMLGLGMLGTFALARHEHSKRSRRPGTDANRPDNAT